jgi:hypothetical protein
VNVQLLQETFFSPKAKKQYFFLPLRKVHFLLPTIKSKKAMENSILGYAD